jgi:hypothetical protein
MNYAGAVFIYENLTSDDGIGKEFNELYMGEGTSEVGDRFAYKLRRFLLHFVLNFGKSIEGGKGQ